MIGLEILEIAVAVLIAMTGGYLVGREGYVMAGTLGLSVAVGLFALTYSRAHAFGWDYAAMISVLSMAAAVLGSFLRQTQRHPRS